ncbi:MAG: nucleotidyltransferase family protein, partial [Alphaproteobacteria bacterium]|nr:nucleotidyltransferase family protein [Alphaproteobacteria bacterium]
MSDVRDLFALLCRLLATRDGATQPMSTTWSDPNEVDWTQLVHVANQHLVAPILHDAVTRAGIRERLPEDKRHYLAALHAANGERNQEIHRQISAFLPALNAAGIEPILLKGTAFIIADPSYGPLRMMADIDYLVPQGSEDAAWDAMTNLGYKPKNDEDSSRSHQLNTLRCDGTVAAVEIHRSVGPQRTIVSVDEAYADSHLLDLNGAKVRVMSHDHRLMHALFNGQVQDFHYWFAWAQMRTLLDIRRLGENDGPGIDWPTVMTRFEKQGYGGVVEGTVALLATWLGAVPPAAVPVTRRARAYVARCERHLGPLDQPAVFRRRWLGWGAKNLLPSRVVFQRELEGYGP